MPKMIRMMVPSNLPMNLLIWKTIQSLKELNSQTSPSYSPKNLIVTVF